MENSNWKKRITIAMIVSLAVLVAIAVGDYFDVLSRIGIDISQFNADVWTGIIIPMISAIIGGGLTMWGVYVTIKDQHEKDAEAQRLEAESDSERRRLEAKPWLFSYDEAQDYDVKKVQYYCMDLSGDMNMRGRGAGILTGLIKNTDNGIMLLDRVESENHVYLPSTGNIVEKGSLIQLIIWLSTECETLENMRLYVKDIYGNTYCYPMKLDGNKFKLGVCEE